MGGVCGIRKGCVAWRGEGGLGVGAGWEVRGGCGGGVRVLLRMDGLLIVIVVCRKSLQVRYKDWEDVYLGGKARRVCVK